MRPVKIHLADLAHTVSVKTTSLTVPLNIGYIKAFTRAVLGDSVKIRLFKNPEVLMAVAEEDRPHIFGFSNYGWNVNLNRAIGTYLRQRFPNALFVAGGPNIDDDLDHRLAFLERHDYLDYVVVGGGEEPFAELVDWWIHRRGEQDRLPQNLIYRGTDGTLKDTGRRPLSKTIENIPSPYLDGCLDEFLKTGMVPLFETNRGCPFRCTFCAWGMASQDLVRRFDLDTALSEIEYVGERSTARNWIICDVNFGILKRDVEIAREIRSAKDRRQRPNKCHVWLAKNVTERNLEIAKILGDMSVPVMAVQSLNPEVLKAIKRGNISTDTYVAYQQRFHAIGSKTYSDLIVPLSAETLSSHIEALRRLCDYGVDIIQCHNMRLLAGAETNTKDTRQRYDFRTRYRLIHGDAGAYRSPTNQEIRAFEYEESLRSTTTMSEDEVFYLRRLHFAVDFCWNIEVYKFLLKILNHHRVNPIDVLERLLSFHDTGLGDVDTREKLCGFWRNFETASRAEWFDNEDEIERHFAGESNWRRLIGNEFDKLNIFFSIAIFRNYKSDFDRAIKAVAESFDAVPRDVLDTAAAFNFAEFPPLDDNGDGRTIEISPAFRDVVEAAGIKAPKQEKIHFVTQPRRREICRMLVESRGLTISKILNTQGVRLSDLRLVVDRA